MDEKFLQYQINDFLEDESWLELLESGKLDEAAWQSWGEKHPETYEHFLAAKRLVEGLAEQKRPLPQARVEKIWKEIDEKTLSMGKARGKKVRYLTYSGIAAAVLILVFFTLNRINVGGTQTKAAEMVSYALPDQSQILLNAGSSLNYHRFQFKKNRTVHLEGEAFFQVTPGNSFLVETALGEVTVLGTSFNVFSRDDQFDVRCSTGRVRVVLAKKDTFYLNPGKAVHFDGTTRESMSYEFKVPDQPLWTKGIFEYTDASLSVVLAELERQFNIRMVLPENITVDTMHYTGLFVNDTLEKALNDVCWPMHLRYEIAGNRVILTAF